MDCCSSGNKAGTVKENPGERKIWNMPVVLTAILIVLFLIFMFYKIAMN